MTLRMQSLDVLQRGYDRDLKWFIRMTWVLLATDVGAAGLNFRDHQWMMGASCMIWALNVWFWQGMIKTSQHTRNMVRLTNAAVLGALEGDEQES